jgi:hypothetical protein
LKKVHDAYMLDSLDLLTWKFPLNKLCLGEEAGAEGAGIPVVKGVLRYFYESTKYSTSKCAKQKTKGRRRHNSRSTCFLSLCNILYPCSMPECRRAKQDKNAVSVFPDIPK